VPDYLLGRDSAINAIRTGLENPAADEAGNLLFVGLRGIGKTVMLTEAGRLAREQGWLVVDSYLTESGLLERIHRRLNTIAAPDKSHRNLEISILGVRANIGSDKETPDLNIVDRLEAVLERTGIPGVLITVDEVHSTASNAQAELREYGNEIQLAHRRKLPIMSAMAGLPGGIRALLKDEDANRKRTGATFLRRAAKEELGAISDEDIWNAYSEAATISGKLISADVLDILTDAAKGYPYLFQLIGQRVWRESGKVVTNDAAQIGIRSAIRRLRSALLDTAFADLSDIDKSFLLAMTQDNSASRTGDIAKRLNISIQQASNYKKRLAEAEIITDGHGYTDFTMPYMREHLREYYASTIRS